MQTKELADLLGVSTASVRDWTINLYKDYMSPTAQGGSGSVRQFSEQDARILALVGTLRADGMPHDDILAILEGYKADEWQDLPPLPVAPPGQGPISMIPRESAETAIQAQRQSLTREIAILSDRVEALEEQLADERQAHTETRETLTAQLMTATNELGELHGQLQAVDREREATAAERSRERQLLTRALVVVAVVAAVLLAVVVLMALSGAG